MGVWDVKNLGPASYATVTAVAVSVVGHVILAGARV